MYGCACTRSAFATWGSRAGRPWRGPGCPGDCRSRGLDGPTLRVALGGADERWDDALLGPRRGPVALGGDLPIRDRHGNWTYGLCVVVDDQRQDVDLVVRGEDLVETDGRPARAGPRPWPRRAADVRPPPADPSRRRVQAVEVGRATRGSASCGRRVSPRRRSSVGPRQPSGCWIRNARWTRPRSARWFGRATSRR